MGTRLVLTSVALSFAVLSHSVKNADDVTPLLPGGGIPDRHSHSKPVQSVEERVNEVKKWYAEAQRMGVRNCKVYRMRKMDGLTADNRFPFDQEVKSCRLNDRYELIQGRFLGYEWGETVNIYKRDGKVFFVFVEGGAEALIYENRYYCGRDESVVRHLQKESEAGEGLAKASNKQVKLPSGRIGIYSYVSDIFERVDEVMKAGR